MSFVCFVGRGLNFVEINSWFYVVRQQGFVAALNGIVRLILTGFSYYPFIFVSLRDYLNSTEYYSGIY